MPAALDVNKEEVRMLVVSVGCHEAARQLGLAEGTVRQWDNRYQWTANIPRSKPLPISRVQPVTLVTSPPEAQRNVIADKMLKVREQHLDLSLIASGQLLKKKPTSLVTKDGAQTLLAVGKHAALVGGWNADSRPDAPGKAFGARRDALVVDAEFVADDPMDDPAF